MLSAVYVGVVALRHLLPRYRGKSLFTSEQLLGAVVAQGLLAFFRGFAIIVYSTQDPSESSRGFAVVTFLYYGFAFMMGTTPNLMADPSARYQIDEHGAIIDSPNPFYRRRLHFILTAPVFLFTWLSLENAPVLPNQFNFLTLVLVPNLLLLVGGFACRAFFRSPRALTACLYVGFPVAMALIERLVN